MLGLATEGRAQAWGQPRAGYFAKASASYLFTREEFSVEGDKQEIAADDPRITNAWFRDLSFYGYLEYGLGDKFTLVSSVPVKILTSEFTQNPGGGLPSRRVRLNNSGLGDLWVSTRSPIRAEPFAFTLQGGIKIPLYEQPPDEGFLTVPPLGTGSVDAEIGMYFGKSLYPLPAYFSGGVAYRWRGGEVHDEIPFNIEGGYTYGRLFAKLRLDGVQNTEEPGGSVIAGDEDYLKLSPTIAYNITGRFTLAFEMFHTMRGKNTLAGTVYSLGVVMVNLP
jgi:hypothetical protein